MKPPMMDLVDYFWIALFVGGPLVLTALVVYVIRKANREDEEGES